MLDLCCGRQGLHWGMWDFLVVTCGIYFSDQKLNPGSLHWEHRALAPGPPEKALVSLSHSGNLSLIWDYEEIYHKTFAGTPHFIALCRYYIFYILEIYGYPSVKQVCWHRFPNSSLLLCFWISHFGNSWNLSKTSLSAFLVLHTYFGNILELH